MKSQKREGKKAGMTERPARKKKAETTAIHAQSKDGTEHVVGIGNLRVMLFNDDGSWFAQGLEIDYAAQGSSIEDVQERFQEGLRETIDFHIQMYGNISGVLQAAPPEVWAELYGAEIHKLFKHSQVTLFVEEDHYRLPFQGIEFYGKRDASYGRQDAA